MADRQLLRTLIDTLNEEELQAARQLLGVSLAVGSPGIIVLRHFWTASCSLCFGRLLLMLLEHMGMSTDQLPVVHMISKWWEIAVFTAFAIFSPMDIYQTRFGPKSPREQGTGA